MHPQQTYTKEQLDEMRSLQASWRDIKAKATASRALDMDRLSTMDRGMRASVGLDDRSLWLIVAIVEHIEAFNEVGLESRLDWLIKRLDEMAPLGRIALSSRGTNDEQFAKALERSGFWKQSGEALAREMVMNGVPPGECAGMVFNRGVGAPGFCKYVASGVPAFLALHPDGLIAPTFMALELVMRLRELNPGMDQSANNYSPTRVPSLDLALAHTRWRAFPYAPAEGSGLPKN